MKPLRIELTAPLRIPTEQSVHSMLTVPTFLILTFFCCLSALITSLYFAATSFGLEGIADGAPALLSAGFEASLPSETGAGAVVLSDGAGAFVSDGAGEGAGVGAGVTVPDADADELAPSTLTSMVIPLEVPRPKPARKTMIPARTTAITLSSFFILDCSFQN